MLGMKSQGKRGASDGRRIQIGLISVWNRPIHFVIHTCLIRTNNKVARTKIEVKHTDHEVNWAVPSMH